MEPWQAPKLPPVEERVVKYVDDLYHTSKTAEVSLQEVLTVVASAEEFLRYYRDRTAVEAAVKHVPDIITKLADKAKKGDVDAAKVILDVSGTTGKNSQRQVNIANQINLSFDEMKELKQEVLTAKEDG